ncbi:hypothetical protein [Desulfoluna spongiiphila]|uniref:YtkA-like n=1 Tax=Desulfoluna spongiiphila TaxID=419481 RepID=A0A1G5I646_9BACT|nr:hypothetical protein [Desulfoluna spongiiphila]SCY70738.1 hypothetical protein SAMN05216233_11792 [Desulfoluna spongiiphila]
MKRHALILSLLALLTLGLFSLASAEHKEHGSSNHGKEMSMDHGKEMKGHGMGEVIRTHTVDDLTLTYRLIDMHQRMKDMDGMESMSGKMASHHLMLDVKGKNGAMVHDAKVGFVITDPDGKEVKTMAMAMGGGHGADVEMKQKGTYTLKVKVKAGDKVVKDSFTHMTK